MYSLYQGFRRKGFRSYILALCVFYLVLVFTFHSNLQGGNTGPEDRLKYSGRKVKQDINQSLQNVIEKLPDDLPQKSAGQKYLDKFVQQESNQKEVVKHRDVPVGAAKSVDNMGNKNPIILGDEKAVPSVRSEPHCIGSKPNVTVPDSLKEILDNAHIFSAFWDTRPNDFDNKNGGTFVRMMGVIRSRQRPHMQCIFELSYGVFRSPVTYYEMCENHGRVWGSYILSCQVPPEVADKGMLCSVRLSEESSPISPHITIHTLEPQKDRRRFTLCVPPLFGQVDKNRLVEFVEASLTVGAQHVVFYDFNQKGVVEDLLRYYKAMDVVTVVNWQLPSDIDKVIWYHGQSLAIQDCLYRNMAWSDYVMFGDVDEVLVPHKHNSWEEMVQEVDSPKLAALQFHSAFFPPVHADHGDPFENLLTLSSTTRTEMLSRFRTKCLVKPTKIFEKGIHHVSKPIFADLEVRRMDDPEYGFLHHYRNCMPNFGMSCHRMVEDETLVKFASKVIDRVKLTKARVFHENV